MKGIMKSLCVLTALLALGAATAHTAKADLALEYNALGMDVPADWLSGPLAGWEFTTNSAITVTALDAWGASPEGTEVWLYSVVPGDFITGGGSLTVLADAFVTSSDPAEGSPVEFNSHSIDPVTLDANATYYIAEDFASLDSIDTAASYSAIITDPSIKYGYPIAGGGYPTEDANFAPFGPGYFGPNFDIAPSVPEPASLLTLAGGLALLAFLRRRREAANMSSLN
ncbi:MAG TPA: PEP-CTERM sorting domain-containing protein [Bryobacteraceae bacterium]|nr:PEP-CTERM sorting domain-containing protein [Bryobacteraceae bacterium]